MQEWDKNLVTRFDIWFLLLSVLGSFLWFISRYHTWIMTFINLSMVVQSNFCNRDFVIDHKFSITLRSGEFPRQSNTFYLCFLKIVFTFLGEGQRARSCWNIPPPSGNALFISVMTILLITSMYFFLNSSYPQLA